MRSHCHSTLLATFIAASVITFPYSAYADTCPEMRPWVLDADTPIIILNDDGRYEIHVEAGGTVWVDAITDDGIKYFPDVIPIQEEPGMGTYPPGFLNQDWLKPVYVDPSECAVVEGDFVILTVVDGESANGTWCMLSSDATKEDQSCMTQ